MKSFLKKLVVHLYWIIYSFIMVLGFVFTIETITNDNLNFMSVIFSIIVLFISSYLLYKILLSDLKLMIKSYKDYFTNDFYDNLPDFLKD